MRREHIHTHTHTHTHTHLAAMALSVAVAAVNPPAVYLDRFSYIGLVAGSSAVSLNRALIQA
jgi:arginine exporter protein ArgO